MFSMIVLAALTFAVNQGEIVRLAFPSEAGTQAMEFRWENRKIPLVQIADQWQSVIGVDLDAKPGEHQAELVVTFQNGRVERRAVIVNVGKTDFPTTELQVEDKYVELSPQNQRRSAREAKELEQIYALMTPEILWTKPFQVPIAGRTGSNFGHRRIFNGQPRAPHAGSDLKASTGTPVHATNRGRVVLAKNLFFTGNTVILDHGLGIYTLYAHLSRIDVKLSDVVNEDQQLGLAGATGRVTGAHLHWAARIQGARVDPFSLLSIE
jgi:murein DD-endopeptidase MepM/ murein hydrolase activator NlpD